MYMGKNDFRKIMKKAAKTASTSKPLIKIAFLVIFAVILGIFIYKYWGTLDIKESIYIFLPPVLIALGGLLFGIKKTKFDIFFLALGPALAAIAAFLLGTNGIQIFIVFASTFLVFGVFYEINHWEGWGSFILFLFKAFVLITSLWIAIAGIVLFCLVTIVNIDNIYHNTAYIREHKDNAPIVVVEKASSTGKSIMFNGQLYEISCNKTAAENDTIKAVIGSDGTIVWLEKITEQ